MLNADGSKTMYMVRLKVLDGAITEVETIKANKGEADRLWDPDWLTTVSPALQLTIREADQDSYYGLIAAAEGYWRAFQTNGTPDYHRASLLPDTLRFENGLQTTGHGARRRLLSRGARLRSRAASSDATSGPPLPRRRSRARHRAVDRPLRAEGRAEEPERRRPPTIVWWPSSSR